MWLFYAYRNAGDYDLSFCRRPDPVGDHIDRGMARHSGRRKQAKHGRREKSGAGAVSQRSRGAESQGKGGAGAKAREKAEQERKAREKAEQERRAREKAEQERKAREKAEQERKAKEKAAENKQKQRFCANCGKPLPEDETAFFCMYCGTKTEAANAQAKTGNEKIVLQAGKCPVCGNATGDTDSVCANCGFPVISIAGNISKKEKEKILEAVREYREKMAD